MDKLSVRRGASHELKLTVDEAGAESARLIVKKSVSDTEPTFVVESPIVNKTADLSLSPEDTDIDPGEYLYQLNVYYEDGSIEKYPETQNCDIDEVSFPTLTVHPSLG